MDKSILNYKKKGPYIFNFKYQLTNDNNGTYTTDVIIDNIP